jgi:hypothetical protein
MSTADDEHAPPDGSGRKPGPRARPWDLLDEGPASNSQPAHLVVVALAPDNPAGYAAGSPRRVHGIQGIQAMGTAPWFIVYRSELISIAALLISIIAVWLAWLSYRTSRRMVEIEENRDKETRRQAAKAKLVANREKTSGATFRLTVRNDGEGTARDISIMLDGTPISSHPAASKTDALVSTLNPGGSTWCILVPTLGKPFPKTIRIEWQDDSGEPGLYESGL